MEYKVYDCTSYNIHTIKTDKFKNCLIEIMFRKKIEKEKITEENLLVDMLMHSSKKYPKRRDVAIELENLYSTSIRGITSRVGKNNITSFCADFLNPKYCEKGYLKNVINMMFEMLLNPNVENEEFDLRSFNIIKNRIKSDIESLKENAPRYAFRRSLLNMDSESISSYSMVGYLEDLESITPSSLYKTYQDFFKNATCDIYVIGNLNMDEVVKIIKDNYSHNPINDNKIDLFVANKPRKKKQEITETGRYEQDSFIIINNLVDLTKKERDFTMQLYNVILGSGSFNSKLFKYLREENSLCYSVSSMYQKYDSLLFIYAGIDQKYKQKCIKLCKKAMDEMLHGAFTDEDLENAKKYIISAIKMNEDSLGGIVNNYLFNDLDNLPLFSERIKEFKKITREEIMDLAKKIKINTIYLLKGEEK